MYRIFKMLKLVSTSLFVSIAMIVCISCFGPQSSHQQKTTCQKQEDCKSDQKCINDSCEQNCTGDSDCHENLICHKILQTCISESFLSEVCDGIDNNLDGRIDELFDFDLDGFSQCGLKPDCDDTNPLVNPQAAENCTDDTDNDCDGFADSKDSECGSTCNVSAICEKTNGVCGSIQPKCIGGQIICDYFSHPLYQSQEISCNDGIDNDCNGFVDTKDSQCQQHGSCTGNESLIPDCLVHSEVGSVGVCAGIKMTCSGGFWNCNIGSIIGFQGSENIVDGLDNDCDGIIDDAQVTFAGLPAESVPHNIKFAFPAETGADLMYVFTTFFDRGGSGDWGCQQHTYSGHTGTDIAPSGTRYNDRRALATADGTVVAIRRWNTSFGYHVIIDHQNGFASLYAHLRPDSFMVEEGQSVKCGDPVGIIGTTGNSTGIHLHFEVRYYGSNTISASESEMSMAFDPFQKQCNGSNESESFWVEPPPVYNGGSTSLPGSLCFSIPLSDNNDNTDSAQNTETPDAGEPILSDDSDNVLEPSCEPYGNCTPGARACIPNGASFVLVCDPCHNSSGDRDWRMVACESGKKCHFGDCL